MNEARRRRLESVILPLTRLENFSADEAKRNCANVNGAYVSRMLRQLVCEGVLEVRSVERENRYRWTASRDQGEGRSDASAEVSPQWAAQWIERQVCGDQVTQTPLSTRPRERLLKDGAAALSDADLLAILIRVGVPKESAVAGGQRIANRFAERMEALADCSQAELRQISPAATMSSYAQIMAGIELGRRIAWIESARPTTATRITSTREAIEYCGFQFARLASHAVQEQFHIVTLDTKHKPIQTHCVTVGTLDASLVHPREVFRPAIRDAASAILLVHNHPSGDPTPSREDLRVTEQLTEAGNLLGIEVLDHIVVARDGCLSIREAS